MSEQRAVPRLTRDERMRAEGAMNALDVAGERIAALTVERDSAKRELAEIEADAKAERKKYEALREERDALKALMELACADIIFFHAQESGPFLGPETPELPKTVAFSVMVNDLFAPAADAEGFDISEAIPLRDIFRKDGFEGVIRWVQNKRDGQPLRPHVEVRVKEKETLRQQRDALAEKVERLETVMRCATEFADAIQTCHICAATLLIEDSPPHCLDCNGDCEYHDEPDCESPRVLLASLDAALLASRTTPPAKERS